MQKQPGRYGHRARIGYTVAAVTTEVFPIDWYKIVPDGVTLMMITLPLGERSAEDARKCYDISIQSAETMAKAMRAKGLPVALLLFEGEGHGFRRAESIVRAFEAEAYFYSRVFGFELGDPVEPIEIDNLP